MMGQQISIKEKITLSLVYPLKYLNREFKSRNACFLKSWNLIYTHNIVPCPIGYIYIGIRKYMYGE